jgi:hypothetical protein
LAFSSNCKPLNFAAILNYLSIFIAIPFIVLRHMKQETKLS